MKRRFVLAFVALFVLFAVGIVISLFYIWRGTTELRDVLALHQIEDLRQDLLRSLERSQQDLEVSGTVFANNLDDIIANVQSLDTSVQSCFGCHHRPQLQREMEGVAELVEAYKGQYGTFITAFLNDERRQQLQIEAAVTAQEIHGIVDSMLLAASPVVQTRTEAATAQVERSWTILLVTLVLTFVAAIAISFLLTRSVTGPLDRLVGATRSLGRGELGTRIEHHEPRELGALMDAFNTMSESLESKTRRIEGYVQRLHRLNENVVSLYARPDEGTLFSRQATTIDSLMDVDLRGCIVKTGLKDVFLVSLGSRGRSAPEHRHLVSLAKLEEIRRLADGPLLVVSSDEVKGWPFGSWTPAEELRNYLVCWVEWHGELQGALLAVNRSSGEFSAEDAELMVTLGQAVGPALHGSWDDESLQQGMELPDSLDEPEVKV